MRAWRPQSPFANGTGTLSDKTGKGKSRILTSDPVFSPLDCIKSDADFTSTVKFYIYLGITFSGSLRNRRHVPTSF